MLGMIAVGQARQQDRFTMHWRLLSLVFLYLSLDEAGRLHERAIVPLRTAFGLTGLLYHSWVLLAIPLVVILGIAYLKFLLHLPPGTRRLFLLAGAVYIGGAVGVEMVEGYYDELQGGVGDRDFLFSLFVAVEEGFEMLGIIIFIHALMQYIQQHVGDVQIRFAEGAAITPAPESPYRPPAPARPVVRASRDVIPSRDVVPNGKADPAPVAPTRNGRPST
jgi:hypothetical protein